jgi:hypothetical protein
VHDLDLHAFCPFSVLRRFSMEVQLLIGVMGTLTVVATYYWLVRSNAPKAEAK